jgi:hypothetical protein
MAQKYREGGGKLYVNKAGSRNRIDDCPGCSFKYFDKEPDFDDIRKENNNISGRWATTREHLEEFYWPEREAAHQFMTRERRSAHLKRCLAILHCCPSFSNATSSIIGTPFHWEARNVSSYARLRVYSILLENAPLVCRVAIMYGMYTIMVKPKPTLRLRE